MLSLDYSDTPEIHDLYETFSGTLAFDIGANAGQVTRIFAENFGRVVAVEPSRIPFDHLLANAAENVDKLQLAVSDVNGEIVLHRREMSKDTEYLFTGYTLPEWGAEVSAETVPAVRMDTLAALYDRPDFVKIDTEGHEVAVVRGGLEVFAKRPEFLIEIHSERNGEEVAAMLDASGCDYRIVRHEAHQNDPYRWANHYWLVSKDA